MRTESLSMQIQGLEPVVQDMLHEDMPVLLSEFRKCLARGDREGARQAVHTVRGSAAFCKLEVVLRAAAELEDSLGRDSDDDRSREAFEQCMEDLIQLLERKHEKS